MPTLDSRIDDLYKQPPGAFVAARNALAKTLAGDDAARVKRLEKPTAIPWAVNQVYWHARPVFDRVRASGETLRQAQIARLAGRSAVDVGAADEAHRQAVARAVQEAARRAREAGVAVNADAVARTFEALSLAKEPPAPPGRLTQPLQPAGFEALMGVTPRPGPARPATGAPRDEGKKADARRTAEAEEKAREERRRAEEALGAAEAELTRAKAAEAKAKDAWEQARREREEAEERVATRNRFRLS